MSALKQAILDYLDQAKKLKTKLESVAGHRNLMRAWRDGLLDKSGKIDGVSYEFHGAGIYIEDNDTEIEIDFLPNCELGGFDSWRIWNFIKTSKKYYQGLNDEFSVKCAIDQEVSNGFLLKFSGTHLYVLSDFHGSVR